MKKLLLLICFLQCTHSFSQDLATLKWWSPTQYKSHVIEGQAWPDEVKSTYDRLPARAEGNVADDVWSLSSHSAGLMIRFRSNTKKIIVRYETKNKDNYAMDHMPATGVSGIDLYAIDSDGKELWCSGIRSFSDTITYRFQGLRANDNYHEKGREYRLYLPLYKRLNEKSKDSGHGGMDGTMIYRIVECLQKGLPLDQNLYEGCFWSSVTELSGKSIAQEGTPQKFPDFTRGNGKNTKPLNIIS